MKLAIKRNFEVVAIPYTPYPRPPGPTSPRRQSWEGGELARVKELEAAINRHCDVERADATWEQVDVCGFCESDWEEEEDGRPVCCEQAVGEFEQAAQARQPEGGDADVQADAD